MMTTNATIKPIETLWKGYRFRSRLEARWAVFFETLGVRWEYEPQGFHLPDSSMYLPDFYLPDQGTYVEIKPKTDFDPESVYCVNLNRNIPQELKKISQLADDWIMIAGNPYPGEYLAFNNSEYGILYAVYRRLFRGNNIPVILKVDCGYVVPNRIYLEPEDYGDKYGHGRLITALATARSVRFEHGEQP